MSLAESSGEALPKVYSDVRGYYSSRLAKYGATPLGVDWSCRATQNLRFAQLLRICDFSAPFSLNDVGCGYGALVTFLAGRHSDATIDYLGLDLSPSMIRSAHRLHSKRGCSFVVGTRCPRVADYSIASGVMNVRLNHSESVWEEFVATTLTDMRQMSRYGFSVNFMSEDRPARDSAGSAATGLYRTDPDRWARFCECELGCSVIAFADYGMREFTLLVRPSQSVCAPGVTS
jgi:hypothetical protein